MYCAGILSGLPPITALDRLSSYLTIQTSHLPSSPVAIDGPRNKPFTLSHQAFHIFGIAGESAVYIQSARESLEYLCEKLQLQRDQQHQPRRRHRWLGQQDYKANTGHAPIYTECNTR